jgi:hypothetical protein
MAWSIAEGLVMRFVMFLLIASAALAGAWPGVRLFWEMEFGAAAFDSVFADGTVQHNTIGPASDWPEWALRPEGVTVQVRATFDASPGQLGTGYGQLHGITNPAQVQARYAEQLRAAGWDVALSHLTVSLPEVPPRSARLCLVSASKDGNSLLLSVTSDMPDLSRLHWTRGPQVPLAGSEPGACSPAH